MKTEIRIGVLVLAALAALACSGGGTKCERICELANACSIDQRTADRECSMYCSDVTAQQDRIEAASGAACKEEFAAHLACWESNSGSICDQTFTGCVDSGKAWTTCLGAFCAANKSDLNCTATGAPALRPF